MPAAANTAPASAAPTEAVSATPRELIDIRIVLSSNRENRYLRAGTAPRCSWGVKRACRCGDRAQDDAPERALQCVVTDDPHAQPAAHRRAVKADRRRAGAEQRAARTRDDARAAQHGDADGAQTAV